MEQDVDNSYRAVCCTCLSTDRNLVSINGISQIYQVFRLLMYDFAGDRFGDVLSEMEQMLCWECLALMRRFVRFKQQVQSAQEHLRIIAVSQDENSQSVDHTYMSQSLSPLECVTKSCYDQIYFEYTSTAREEWATGAHYITIEPGGMVALAAPGGGGGGGGGGGVKDERYDVAQAVRDNIHLDIDQHNILGDIELAQGQVTGIMSHIVVADGMVADSFEQVKGELADLTGGATVTSDATPQLATIVMEVPSIIDRAETKVKVEKEPPKGYTTELMTEEEMLATREEAKKKVQYASSIYKCELCIVGFYAQQQVEDHFVTAHEAKPGVSACKVCFTYVEPSKLEAHERQHYVRHTCKLCGHAGGSEPLMEQHVAAHSAPAVPASLIQIGDAHGNKARGRQRKRKMQETPKTPPKPGDLRKLLSKTTIEGYQCLECDMFFKNSRARKNHVARCHREGLQCDHCKKRFVNRTTLTTHLKLHAGPPPRSECPVCHKMVRVVQLKYHVQRHQTKGSYECADCHKLFSHLATYQAHLKYSRAHATDTVFKFPCPMCNKGYPTKEAMQDHFNYQHLGKTSHKCPVCDKPIASKANVEKHIMRVHGEKKPKPRSHVCDVCGKGFTDKKALTQHEVIHSKERPLTCDICHQSFRQKASLYTHRKRVHKVFPAKKVVEFMESKVDT